MEPSRIHPGPVDHSVLKLQSTHRSRFIWDGVIGDTDLIHPRRADSSFWQHMKKRPPHDRIIQCLYRSAFWGVYAVGRIQLDWALITALLERWRPETHTFHFRSGEATITLQDIEIMYGLPVDGEPVEERPCSMWQAEMERLTGFRPDIAVLEGCRLKITAIDAHMSQLEDLTDDHPDEEVNRRCRLYILWMIGGIIFPDTSGSKVSLEYLPLLEDVDQTVHRSWGSAALSYLYRCLCRSSMDQKSDIGGFLPLLQVWAWERLLPIQPIPRPEPMPNPNEVPPPEPPSPPPYAKKWARGVDRDVAIGHFLPLYRDQFDTMGHDQLIWLPYSETIIAGLPERCSKGSKVWMAEVPLICLNVVEHHAPKRVLRQFGLAQGIPENSQWKDKHYQMDKRSNVDHAYIDSQIVLWNRRVNCVVKGVPAHVSIPYNDPYMVWYRRITRSLIGNPARDADRGYQSYAGRHEALGRALHFLYRMGLQMQQDAVNETVKQWAERVSSVSIEGLLAASQGRRLSFDPDYAPSAEHDDGPTVNLRRGGGAGRVRGGGRARDGIRARGGRQGGKTAPVEHHLVDDDDDEDLNMSVVLVPDHVPLERTSASNSGNPRKRGRADVEHNCGPSTSDMGSSQFASNSTQFDDESGSGSYNFDRQIVVYNPAPLKQFPMNNCNDGFDDGDDGYFPCTT